MSRVPCTESMLIIHKRYHLFKGLATPESQDGIFPVVPLTRRDISWPWIHDERGSFRVYFIVRYVFGYFCWAPCQAEGGKKEEEKNGLASRKDNYWQVILLCIPNLTKSDTTANAVSPDFVRSAGRDINAFASFGVSLKQTCPILSNAWHQPSPIS